LRSELYCIVSFFLAILESYKELEAIQRWSAMSRVTLNFDLSKIPFVHFQGRIKVGAIDAALGPFLK